MVVIRAPAWMLSACNGRHLSHVSGWEGLYGNRHLTCACGNLLPAGYVFWIAATEEGEVYTCNTQVPYCYACLIQKYTWFLMELVMPHAACSSLLVVTQLGLTKGSIALGHRDAEPKD
jgi:hypothetical protein